MFHKDGHVVWMHDEATMVRDDRGVPRFSHGVMMDISARKRADEDVAFLAYHDELTGLPSRSMFEELLTLSIDRASRHDGAVAAVVRRHRRLPIGQRFAGPPDGRPAPADGGRPLARSDP